MGTRWEEITDDKVGYCKPPKHTRFQKGICPNPKGRGKREADALASAVDDVLNTKVGIVTLSDDG